MRDVHKIHGGLARSRVGQQLQAVENPAQGENRPEDWSEVDACIETALEDAERIPDYRDTKFPDGEVIQAIYTKATLQKDVPRIPWKLVTATGLLVDESRA